MLSEKLELEYELLCKKKIITRVIISNRVFRCCKVFSKRKFSFTILLVCPLIILRIAKLQ